VEFALVVLPLLLLLLGIVEFARVFYTQLRLQQAAQQAARQIALHYDDPGLTSLSDLVDETLLDALDGVVDDLSDLTYKSVSLCTIDPLIPEDAEVVLRYTVPVAVPVDPVTVTGSATMPCEG
jgi:TadE-like protein